MGNLVLSFPWLLWGAKGYASFGAIQNNTFDLSPDNVVHFNFFIELFVYRLTLGDIGAATFTGVFIL